VDRTPLLHPIHVADISEECYCGPLGIVSCDYSEGRIVRLWDGVVQSRMSLCEVLKRWEDRIADIDRKGTYKSTNDRQCHSDRQDKELSPPPPPSETGGGGMMEAEKSTIGNREWDFGSSRFRYHD
jgi:hypothetical protein